MHTALRTDMQAVLNTDEIIPLTPDKVHHIANIGGTILGHNKSRQSIPDAHY